MLDRFAARWVSLESHSLVVAAVKRSGRTELAVGEIAEPLEVLSRSLDREAALGTRSARAAARRRLVDALIERARLVAAAPPVEDGPVVLVGGAPGSAPAQALRATLAGLAPVATGAGHDPDGLEPTFSSFGFELSWHVPAYAEWLDGADLTAAAGRLAQRVGPSPTILCDPVLLEHLPELRAAIPHVRLVAVRDDPAAELDATVALAVRERDAATGSADEVALRRYWSWRLDRWRRRRDDQLDAGTDLIVDASLVAADPRSVAREVSESTGLCQAG